MASDLPAVSILGPPTNLPLCDRFRLARPQARHEAEAAIVFSIMFSETDVTKHSWSQAPSRRPAPKLEFSCDWPALRV